MGSNSPDRGAVGRKRDDAIGGLRAAIDQLAATDAAELLAEARVEARARVRARLIEVFTDSMLDHLGQQLPSPPRSRSSSAPRDTGVPAEPHMSVPAEPQMSVSAEPQMRERVLSAQPNVRERVPPDGPPAQDVGQLGWYVYGVVSAATREIGPLRGVSPEHPVTIVREEQVAAVTSQVPLEEFGEARLREHLGDMDWVEATARAHEGVLEDVQRQVTVIPMRMCSVYRSEDGVRELLRRESEALDQALEHLEGKAEWGVKVFAGLGRAGSGGDADGEELAPAGGAAPGAAYMQRKRQERQEQERMIQLLEEAAGQIHDRLAAVAGDALMLAPQRPEASGRSDEMILNGVYLVPGEAGESFFAEVHALRSEFEPLDIELVATGPWPAYNFVPGTIGAAW